MEQKFERYWLIPLACLFVLLAEYSRYLTATRLGALVFAPRNFLILGGLTLLVWALVVLFKKESRQKAGLWQLLLVPALLIGWTLLSLTWSHFPQTIPLAYEWLNGFVLVALIGVAVRPSIGSKYVATALLVAVIGIVLIGLIEKLADTHLPLSNLHNPYRQQWAITSVFIGQNHLAASLGLLLPLLAGFGLAWNGLRRWLSLGTVAAGLVAVFFTGSSLTLLALALAALIFFIVALVRLPKYRSKLWLVALAVALLIGLNWFVLPDSVRERVSLATIGVRQSFDARWTLVQEGIRVIKLQPWRGLGPGASSQLVTAELPGQPTLHALHNLSLEFVVTFGLIAAFVTAIWLVWIVVRVARRLAGPGQRWPTTGILASLAALLSIQAVPSTFEGVRAPFIVLGFALALALRPRPVAQKKVVVVQS
ncbi:MAG: O-antigen ligase family protein [Candidatus Andersenbacteria bacterium]